MASSVPSSRQVRVLGEATDPVAIPYRDQMTLLDVMISTKGLTRFAAGNRAVIIRRYGGPRQVIPVRLSDLIKDGDIDQNVMMAPGDVLLIPPNLLLTGSKMYQTQLLIRKQLSAAWRYRWPAVFLGWLVCAVGWVGVMKIPNTYGG